MGKFLIMTGGASYRKCKLKTRKRKEERKGLGQMKEERGMTEGDWRRKARERKEVIKKQPLRK